MKKSKLYKHSVKKVVLPLVEDHPAVKIVLDAFDAVLRSKTLKDFLAATQKMFQANHYYYEHIRRAFSHREDIDTRLSVNFATHYNGVKNAVTQRWLLNPNVPVSVVEFWTEFFKEHGDFDEIVSQRVNETETIQKEQHFYALGKSVRHFLIQNRIPESILHTFASHLVNNHTQFPKTLLKYLHHHISDEETTQTIINFKKQSSIMKEHIPPSILSTHFACIISYIIQQTKPHLVEPVANEVTHILKSGISYFMKFFMLGLLGKPFTRRVLESFCV